MTLDNSANEQLLQAKLNQETARLPWRDLQRFFASGSTIAVDPTLDLLQVAQVIANDDAAQLKHWLDQEQIGQVSDAQAKTWYEADTELWTLVIKPWVLVQEPSGTGVDQELPPTRNR
ncbi:DUF2288 domain-containing protein [Marinimicrobium alkaliphilum]|uniref:DUF2288 domain-containing protein n=1 Tax=Marinimicrobium alkaliphilum TaxID=2202654 RepID=UPI000DB9982E|nr:DUF2288 domain-containing protein [Marinimicrobium alkaliphilum]